MTTYTLTVATSADGYISRSTDEPPQAWASAEEQELFFRDVDAADWAIMGRNTHQAADKPQRRRIIFSSKTIGWQRDTQLWIDPEALTPDDLPGRVEDRFQLENGLILGGTRVHDWFLQHKAMHQVNLTVEPVVFGDGLPVFSDSAGQAPRQIFESRGFYLSEHRPLNDNGTEYMVYRYKG